MVAYFLQPEKYHLLLCNVECQMLCSFVLECLQIFYLNGTNLMMVKSQNAKWMMMRYCWFCANFWAIILHFIVYDLFMLGLYFELNSEKIHARYHQGTVTDKNHLHVKLPKLTKITWSLHEIYQTNCGRHCICQVLLYSFVLRPFPHLLKQTCKWEP